MEFIVAIMIYLGILSPEATTQMSQAEMDMLIQQNQQSIQMVMSDPYQVQAVNDAHIIDRRED
jgi:hypothetical protein